MNDVLVQEPDKYEVSLDVISAEAEAMKRIFNEKKKALNLTQRELAHRMKVKPPSVFAYLNGQTPLNIKFATFFAEQLEVSIDEFSPRMAIEYGKITGKIDQVSHRYPILTVDQIQDFREITNKIREGLLHSKTYPSDVNVGPNGFWIKLDSDDMSSYNGGLSFSKGIYLLISPDEKPRVNEFALLKIKYNSPNSTTIIESNDKYIFRTIAHNGESVVGRPFNLNASTITLTDQNAELVGKVVSAFYPVEMFTA